MQKSSRSHKKQTKSYRTLLPQLPVSSKVARMIILLLIFVNIGAFYLVSAHASTTRNITFILFCARDQCSGDVTRLNNTGFNIYTWYGKQTGKSFTAGKTIRIDGWQNASFYGGPYYSTDRTWENINNELRFRGIIPADGSKKVIVQLGFRSMSNCGVGESYGQLAISDPFKGCSNIQNSVLAHELAHTILGRVHTSDGRLMHAPLACNGKDLNNCLLADSHKSVFRASPFFNVTYSK
jgi:hypothetical protein